MKTTCMCKIKAVYYNKKWIANTAGEHKSCLVTNSNYVVTVDNTEVICEDEQSNYMWKLNIKKDRRKHRTKDF